jgi:microcystin-dependent protein
MSDPFIAEIRIVGFNFAPRGWALCNGQLLPISQNTALFSLVGTTYGGNGTTNFALPNLQGSAPMHPGQGPGLTPRTLGETDGSETVSLLASEVPAHAHGFLAAGTDANTSSPANASPAVAEVPQYRPSGDTSMAPAALGPAGSGQPHNNMQPYLTLTFVIALQGVFPSRP